MKTGRIVSALLAIALFLTLCGCGMDSAEKPVGMYAIDWVDVDFEEACDKAAAIVIGTVIKVPRARMVEIPEPEWSTRDPDYEAYTDVKITVEETLKGKHRKTVTYVEIGGETKDMIYRADTVPLLAEGDRVLIFLYADGKMIVPSYLLRIDADDNIKTHEFPAHDERNGALTTLNVYEYAKLITDHLGK